MRAAQCQHRTSARWAGAASPAAGQCVPGTATSAERCPIPIPQGTGSQQKSGTALRYIPGSFTVGADGQSPWQDKEGKKPLKSSTAVTAKGSASPNPSFHGTAGVTAKLRVFCTWLWLRLVLGRS